MTYTRSANIQLNVISLTFKVCHWEEQGPRVGRTENLVLSFLLGSGGSAAKGADVEKLTQFEKNEG